jgi:ribosomal-protein-alanine N-acetyltransferase
MSVARTRSSSGRATATVAEGQPTAASGWKIRPFRPHDAQSILGILRDSTEAAQWPAESYAKLASFPSGIVLVSEVNAQVIGFVAARSAADEGELLNIAVRPGFRRQGIASALLLAVLETLRRSAVTHLFLELRASNLPARALYEHHGFVPSGFRKAYYRDPLEDALCMQKDLTISSG